MAVGIPQLTIVIQGLLAGAGKEMMLATLTGMGLFAQLLSLNAQAASVAWSGRTALHVAAQESAAAVEHCLRDSQADLEARDSTGATPLLLAARFNHMQTLECLLEAGARWDAEDSKGVTGIMWAAGGGHTATVEALAKLGADVNAAEKDHGATSLMGAAAGGFTAYSG